MARKKPAAPAGPAAENYQHPESKVLLRPDVGTQPQFRKKKPPRKYRYDSSLSPALDWDSQNPARELGEWLIALIEETASLPPPHAFDPPRRWRGGELEIRDLHEAATGCCSVVNCCRPAAAFLCRSAMRTCTM